MTVKINIEIPQSVLEAGAAADYLQLIFNAFTRHAAKAAVNAAESLGVASPIPAAAEPVKQPLSEINELDRAPVEQPAAPVAAPAAEEPVKRTRAPRGQAKAKQASEAPAAPEQLPTAENPQDAADEMVCAAINGSPVVPTRAALNDIVQEYVKKLGMESTGRLGDIAALYPINGDGDAINIERTIRAVRYALEHDKPGAPAPLPDFSKLVGAIGTAAPEAAASAPAADDDDLFGSPTPAAKTYAPSATLDDVKKALGAYRAAYGHDFAIQDCPQILTGAVGVQVVTLKDIPDTPLNYGAAFAALDRALDGNPFGRTRLSTAA